jgi:pimeloyl-ACP methyl ester carboxylesterase
MAAAQPRVDTFSVWGNEIIVRVWGSPRSPTVVYWPGLNPFGALDLIEAGPTWSDRHGFQVVAISAPGCGESAPLADSTDYRPSRLALLVSGVMEALELEGAAFVGFSWGGAVGAHLAAQLPERVSALVLLDSGYNDPQLEPSYQQSTAAELEASFREQQDQFQFPSWDTFVSAVSAQHANWRPSLDEKYRAGMTERDGRIVPRSRPESAAAAFHGIETEPVANLMPRLVASGVPVLLLAAGGILTTEAWLSEALDQFSSAWPEVDVTVIPSVGHDILGEDPATIDLVGEWLQLKARRRGGHDGPRR